MKKIWPLGLLVVLVASVLSTAPVARAEAGVRLSRGQTVYVAVYSNVFSGDRAQPFNLAGMLSIRNTDPDSPLKITAIGYYDNDGKLLKQHLQKPQMLNPLASTHVFVRESDVAGGFGAKFLVTWEAGADIVAPLIEGVMIGARSGQGISFVCPGVVIAEKK